MTSELDPNRTGSTATLEADLDTMPIEELQGLAREKLKERFAQSEADELPKIMANLPEYIVEKANRKLAVVTEFLASVPEVNTFLQRTQKRIKIASNGFFNKLVLTPYGLHYITTAEGSMDDFLNYPHNMHRLWDGKENRSFVEMLANLDFGNVVQKLGKGISKVKV